MYIYVYDTLTKPIVRTDQKKLSWIDETECQANPNLSVGSMKPIVKPIQSLNWIDETDCQADPISRLDHPKS